MERALIWILTPATSGERKPSSSTCWHRNIMVHKCFCAMKQIGRSKYTARNQTVCFKRSQELLKPSWNTTGEKAVAAPIPEAGWHCSSTMCGSSVLPSWPASHGSGASNKQEKSLLLSPEVLQDGPDLGKRKSQNCMGLTTYSWGTGVPSPGDITVLKSFLECSPDAGWSRSLKATSDPWVPNTFSLGSTEVSSFHSS